jgi:hypothetical protein
MVGAAIFELDLAFLDSRFLDLESGQCRFCNEQKQSRDRATG